MIVHTNPSIPVAEKLTMTKHNRIIEILEESLNDVKSEIETYDKTQVSLVDPMQLNYLVESIEGMIQSLKENPCEVPAPENFSRMIIDGWPDDFPLGRKLINAEYIYEKYYQKFIKKRR